MEALIVKLAKCTLPGPRSIKARDSRFLGTALGRPSARLLAAHGPELADIYESVQTLHYNSCRIMSGADSDHHELVGQFIGLTGVASHEVGRPRRSFCAVLLAMNGTWFEKL